jgi:flavin-dependent dehydrogenase
LKLDVAIIGASSAGLYAAELLARAGKHVAVFEQQISLNPARRTLIVTPQLQSFLNPLPEVAVLHRIHVMAVQASRSLVQVDLQNPDLIVERRALAQFLARRAQEAGAQIHFGCRFKGLAPHPEGAAIHFQRSEGRVETMVAHAVIGADGAFSRVARAAGLHHPPTIPILQAEVRLPRDWDPAVTQVWFDTRETRFFYWLIPESHQKGVVGLIGNEGTSTRRLQTVHQDTNPLYWQLIKEFENLTGVPVVLNTSFNENEPIVCTPNEAIECFLRTKMDALVIGNYLVKKSDADTHRETQIFFFRFMDTGLS